MANANSLVGNPKNDNSRYCFAKPGSLYLVYLPKVEACTLDLSHQSGDYDLQWFNTRSGGKLQAGNITTLKGGSKAKLGKPGDDPAEDWLAVIRAK